MVAASAAQRNTLHCENRIHSASPETGWNGRINAEGHLEWHARLAERIPDAKARDLIITIADLSAGTGRVTRHYGTLAAASRMSSRTARRKAEYLHDLGELDVVQRKIKRDFNGANTFIIRNYAAFVGGPCQIGRQELLKANTKNLVPRHTHKQRHRCRNYRHSSRIGGRWCDQHGIQGFARQPFIQRVQDLLDAGWSVAAIHAELEKLASEEKAAVEQRQLRQHTPRTRRYQQHRERHAAMSQFRSKPSDETDEELEAAHKQRELERERIAAEKRQLAAEERERAIRNDPRWRWFDEQIALQGFAKWNGQICRTDEEFCAASYAPPRRVS